MIHRSNLSGFYFVLFSWLGMIVWIIRRLKILSHPYGGQEYIWCFHSLFAKCRKTAQKEKQDTTNLQDCYIHANRRGQLHFLLFSAPASDDWGGGFEIFLVTPLSQVWLVYAKNVTIIGIIFRTSQLINELTVSSNTFHSTITMLKTTDFLNQHHCWEVSRDH